MKDKRKEINSASINQESPASPLINAQEVGWSVTPASINYSSPSFF